MIDAPNLLLIGAAGRDAGKTTFACSLIARFSEQAVIGAKVTAIQERGGACPRGGEGCGVCSGLKEAYCITEELDRHGAKDTQRLLAAGASRVFWLRVHREELETGARALLERIGTDLPVICESNSLRHVVKPGLFLMLRHENAESAKASALAVEGWADRVILTSGTAFQWGPEHISFKSGTWHFKEDGAAS